VRVVLIVHAVAGLGLLVLVPAKVRIARRGLARRDPGSTWPSIVLAVALAVTVLSGVLHSTGLVLRYGPLDDMQVHVGAALVTVPLAAWHVLARGPRPSREDLDRRALLRSALLVGVAGSLVAAREGVTHAADLPGSRRRGTGSYEQGSHVPSAMPRTIWLFDPSLDLDPAQWRLLVSTPAGERSLALDDVPRSDRVTAILDCTGGWWAEQDWAGVRLDRLVGPAPAAGARSVLVSSHTGYSRRFPLRDLPRLWLATHYAGQPLAAGHGAPARLVAPGRRGFWWVKWVTRVAVDDVPWWRQPPFPLQ
jgi:DMSO/TMAO reductase YedYZ molybdopterin-dependent catalytic subunit